MQTELKVKNCPSLSGGIFRTLLTATLLVAAGVAVGALTGRLPLMLTGLCAAGALALALTFLRPELMLTLFYCGTVIMTDAVPDEVGDFFAIPDRDIIQGLPSALILVFLILLCITTIRVLFIERRALPVSPFGLGAYAAILLLAVLTGIFKNNTGELIRFDFMKMLFPVLCFFLCLIILDTRARIERLLRVLLAVSALKALILLVFYLAGQGWPYDTYRIATQDSADLLVFITLVLIVLYLLMLRDLRGFKAGLAGAACIPMILVIIFAYRRAQWIGLILSLSLLYLGSAKVARRRMAILLTGALCVGIAFAVVTGLSQDQLARIASRLASILDKNQHSNVYHQLESQVTLQDLSRSPLLGMGLGGHHSRLPGYDMDVVPTNVVHNTFLYVWMKTGLPGLLFFLWAAALYGRRIFRSRRDHPQDAAHKLLLPLASSSGLWLAMFLTGPTLWYFHQTFLIALFAAITMSLVRQAEDASNMQQEVSI